MNKKDAGRQVVSAYNIAFESGKEKGKQGVLVNVGALEVLFNKTNALDIAWVKYKGNNISFLSKNGLNSNIGEFPNKFEGGFLYTCGTDNVSSCVCGKPVHGSLHYSHVENVYVTILDDSAEVFGTVRQTALFAENIALQRHFTVRENEITVCDTVYNEAYTDTKYVLLYHTNFGYPFLDERLKLDIPFVKSEGLTDYAKSRIGKQLQITEPIDGGEEEVFYNTLEKGEVTLTNEQLKTRIKVINVIDFEIGTKEEFFGWYKNYKANVTKYIVLAADIDFGGADLGNAITDYWWASDWNDPVTKQNICFEGVFDGGNHVLSNFTASVPVFSGIKAGAEIKNLSMIDYTVGQYGLIACSMYGGTIENCYFEGTLVKTTGHKAAMFDNLNGGTIKNVSVVAHDYEGDKLPSVANSIEPVSINDLYIVDYATNGTIASKDASADKTVYLYEDMNTGLESLPAAFNADAWTLYNGVVVTKSAAAYYNAYTDGLTFAINTLSVKLNDEVKISAKLGDAEENGAVWTIEGLTDGQYTFENGMFCVTDESALGTVVTVKASVIKKGIIRFAAQTTFTVEKQDKQVVELGESVLAGKNRSADYTVTLDENQVFVALYVDDVAVENTVGIDGVTATIPNAALNNLSVGSHAIKLETESIVYKFNVNVVDFALGTAEEFDDWYKTKYSSNLSAYVVLTDNISLGWTSAFANNYSGHFEGTFDGCGYAVDGFYTSSYGFIPFLFGTLKNVAFTNVKLTTPGVGFMGHQTGGTVSDVYYQGEQAGANVAGSQSVGSFYTWTSGNPSVKNLVISVTRVCGADSDAFSRSRYANIENIYVANNSSIGNTVTTGVNYYASHTEMKNAVAELPAGFGDMWTIDPYVGLTMKSAVGNHSVKWSEETTFMSSISSDTYMSSQAHADMVTEEGTLNGLKVYGIALTDYTANKTFMSWRSLGFSQFNFAVKTSVKQGMLGTAISLDADTWTYLVFKKGSDDKIHCYVSLDKYLGYHEVALGGYTGWCGNTADMIRFGVAGTFNAYFTDIFTVA